jgi:hypothetical protein
MTVMKILTVIFLLVTFTANAQTASDSTIFSRIYLPFGFGTSITDDSKTYSGKVLLTGFEYRFKKTRGLLFRFNFDYRLQKYIIAGNSTYNVSEGKLEFTDYLIGVGDRFGEKKLRIFGLIQGGITSYKYPYVTGNAGDYKLSDVSSRTPAFRSTIGLEYYLNSNFLFTFETSYTIIPTYSIFWDKQLNILEFSLGISTTLF